MSIDDSHGHLMDDLEYRKDRFHDIFCEIVNLATASEEELNQVLADEDANNEKHKQRVARAHAIFEKQYGRKVN